MPNRLKNDEDKVNLFTTTLKEGMEIETETVSIWHVFLFNDNFFKSFFFRDGSTKEYINNHKQQT